MYDYMSYNINGCNELNNSRRSPRMYKIRNMLYLASGYRRGYTKLEVIAGDLE